MTYDIVSERKLMYAKPLRRPDDVYDLLKRYSKSKQEQFIVVTLDGAHVPIAMRIVTKGLLNKTIVHAREVFRSAITDSAAAIILAHNHPSGQLEASAEDRNMTAQLKQAGELLGIPVLDHIIFTKRDFLSFANSGKL